MKILVTGGTGFIGSNIVNELINHHEVYITGNNNEVKANNYIYGILPLDGEMLDFDVVFHQAACNDTLSDDYAYMMNINVRKSLHLIEKVYQKGCRKFIFASTTAVYGNEPAPYFEHKTVPNPLNVYARSKLILEQQLKVFHANHPDMDIVGLRYCNVYGMGEQHKNSRASMITQILNTIEMGCDPTLFRDGEQKRDWIYVKDVVRANIAAMNYKGCEMFNCGGGQAVTFNELIDIISRLTKKVIWPRYVENPYKDFYQNYTECNMDKIKEALNFEPLYSIPAGIKDYLTLRLQLQEQQV